MSPNNNQDTDTASLPTSTQAKVTYMRAGKILASQDLNNDQPEATLYSNDAEDDGIEVNAGVDQNGFYIDAFDGDKGRAYTLGNGYEWQAETNDVPKSATAPKMTDTPAASGESVPTNAEETAVNSAPSTNPTTAVVGKVNDNHHQEKVTTPSATNQHAKLFGLAIPQLGNATKIELLITGLVVVISAVGVSLVVLKRKRVNR